MTVKDQIEIEFPPDPSKPPFIITQSSLEFFDALDQLPSQGASVSMISTIPGHPGQWKIHLVWKN